MRALFLLWTLQGFAAFNLTWGTPALSLDANPPLGDTDNNAYIAIDSGGNAVATWSRTTGSQASEKIWASIYNHSLRVWTGPVKISAEGSASNSQTAMDKEGNAIFIWEEGFPTRICYRVLSQAGIWSPDLSSPPGTVQPSKNGQTMPQVAFDGRGRAIAVWRELFDGVHHVFSAQKFPDSNWVGFGEISSGQRDACFIPSKSLVVNRAGEGFAIWEEADGKISGGRLVEGGWLPSFLVAENGASSPSAGIDDQGDVIAVWSQDHAIFSKRIEQGNVSKESLVISNPNYIAERPHVGVDANGNAIVVYERYNSIHKFIVASTLAKGAPLWTLPIDISVPSPSDAAAAGYPVFSMNSIGDAVAIWKEWTGENMVIRGAGYSVGTWSSIKTLSSLKANAGSSMPAYDISVALNNAGNILAIWPEDPLKNGAGQIKATAGTGLANQGPMPPRIDPASLIEGVATGRQEFHRFPAHADLINILTWESPGNVSHFNIYRGSLSSLIATTSVLRYEDHQRLPKQKETYLITSVDQHGQESSPITIVVPAYR